MPPHYSHNVRLRISNAPPQEKHGGDNPGHDQVADIDPSVVAPQANSAAK